MQSHDEWMATTAKSFHFATSKQKSTRPFPFRCLVIGLSSSFENLSNLWHANRVHPSQEKSRNAFICEEEIWLRKLTRQISGVFQCVDCYVPRQLKSEREWNRGEIAEENSENNCYWIKLLLNYSRSLSRRVQGLPWKSRTFTKLRGMK